MKTFWTILISVIATAILVGGGIYYWQSTKAKNDKNNLNTQISSLQSQVKDLQTKAATSTTTTSTTTTTNGTSSSTDLTTDSNGIKVGTVTIDNSAIITLQAAVDNGTQPWRLDPLQLAKGDATTYGFTSADTANFAIISQAASAGTAEISASHNGKNYQITVTKPTPGTGKIYAISKIQAV